MSKFSACGKICIGRRLVELSRPLPGFYSLTFALTLYIAVFCFSGCISSGPGQAFADSHTQGETAIESELMLDQIILETNLIAAVIQQEDGISVSAEEYIVIYQATKNDSSDGFAGPVQSASTEPEITEAAAEVAAVDASSATLTTTTPTSGEDEVVQLETAALELASGVEVVVVTAELETLQSALPEEPVAKTSAAEDTVAGGQYVTVESESAGDTETTQQQPETVEVAAIDNAINEDSQDSALTANSITPEPTVDEFSSAEQTVRDWAAAWSQQDLDSYLGYYSANFVPAEITLDRKTWETVRRERVSQPQRIEIALSDLNFEQKSEDHTKVTFVQKYESDSYQDHIVKSVELIRSAQGWRIVSEKTVKVLSN